MHTEQPEAFPMERTTVWSFPERGRWSTHRGDYRGNWPPPLVRNLILKYSGEGDVVVDPMCGSGTTLIECASLDRVGRGFDINPSAVSLSRDRVPPEVRQQITVADARSLDVPTASAQLVALHPPYANVIRYSDAIEGDLSRIQDLSAFLHEMSTVAREAVRIVKPGGYVALLMGDIRRRREYIPLGSRVMDLFLHEGLVLRDAIVKLQHNCRSSAEWAERAAAFNFHLIAHEHLFIFQRPLVLSPPASKP